MSGYVGLVAGQVASLLSQPAPLIIGTLILEGYEVPSRITVGGAQAVMIHKLPGGGRIIDAMGADEGAITWRGVFVGPDAAQRARSLDTMRVQGIPQVLSFGDYTFNVIVVHCEYDYQNRGAVISYRVRTEIVPNPYSLTAAPPGLDLALQDDLETGQTVLRDAAAVALTYATLANTSDAAQITASAFGLNAIAAGLGNTAVTAAATTLSALPGNGVIQAGLQTAGTALRDGIQGFSGSTSLSSSVGLSFGSASALAASTGQAAALAALVQAGGYVNRAQTNLSSANAQIVAPLVHA